MSATNPPDPWGAVVRASDFVNSIGINTHIDFKQYGYENLDKVASALSYLGLHNVRDSAGNPDDAQSWLQVAKAVAQSGAGQHIQFDDFLPEGSTSLMQQALKWAPNLDVTYSDANGTSRGLLNFLEGGNEEDNSYATQQGNSQGNAASLLKQTSSSATGDPGVYQLGQSLGLPVINISFGSGWTSDNAWQGDYGTVGDLSASTDFANAHAYPVAGQTTDSTISRINGLANLAASTKPVVSTEIGWDAANFDHGDIAKYVLDATMDGIKDGDVKTYFYALFDDGSGQFGLMNSDGTSKPAGAALHNLIALMNDNGTGAGNFQTTPLGYSLAGTSSGDNSLVFEKTDGSYWLSTWNETGATDHSVTVTLNSPAAGINLYDPMSGTAVLPGSPTNPGGGITSFQMPVSDHPQLAEIIPATSGAGNADILGLGGSPTSFLAAGGDTAPSGMTAGSASTSVAPISAAASGSTDLIPSAAPALSDTTMNASVAAAPDPSTAVVDVPSALPTPGWDPLQSSPGGYAEHS
jgi:hypothetical protein